MGRKRNLKRKLLENHADLRPSKRHKAIKNDLTLDELAWNVVNRPSAAGIDEEGGMLMLEEVEGVEVYYEETKNGKIAKFREVIVFLRS
jgi:ATP-dependent RNA helicase DDX24/MAK5